MLSIRIISYALTPSNDSEVERKGEIHIEVETTKQVYLYGNLYDDD